MRDTLYGSFDKPIMRDMRDHCMEALISQSRETLYGSFDKPIMRDTLYGSFDKPIMRTPCMEALISQS